MISNFKLITLSSIFLLIVFSCQKTNDDRTALDHAYACQDVLGPLPNFSCADAIEVPTTKNGTPVTFGPAGDEGPVAPTRTIATVLGRSVWLVKQVIK